MAFCFCARSIRDPQGPADDWRALSERIGTTVFPQFPRAKRVARQFSYKFLTENAHSKFEVWIWYDFVVLRTPKWTLEILPWAAPKITEFSETRSDAS